MKRTISKIISILLASAILVGAMPVFAQEPSAPVISASFDEFGDCELSWEPVSNATQYRIYHSSDGVNFTLYNEVSETFASVWSNEDKQMHEYYVTAVTTYWEYVSDGEYYDEVLREYESQPSNKVSVPSFDSDTVWCYYQDDDENNPYIEIDYYQTDDEPLNKYFDGYKIFMSVNGGEFNELATLPILDAIYISTSSYGEKYYECRYTLPSKLSPGRYRLVAAKYAIINGVSYCQPDFNDYSEFEIWLDAPNAIVKTKSVKLSWKRVNDASAYQIHQVKNGKDKIVATVDGKATKYTVKNVDTYKNSYSFYITCLSNGVSFCSSESVYADDSEIRLKSAKKSKKKKSYVTVANTRTKKTKTAWNVPITKKDKKIMDRWMKKNFKKGMTEYEKINYALWWINSKVTYAEGGKYNKIANCSYAEAIFEKKLGQCLQYNGAAAMLLTYMGYDVRIVQGWRGYSMKNKWSHYWAEIKIDGRWYLVETGNHQDGLSPRFAIPYRQTGGYMLNQKPAK